MADPVLDSRDLAHAHHELQRLYGQSELIPLGGRAGFHARVRTAALGKVRLVETALGSEVAVRPAPLTDSYAIHVPLAGTMDVRRDGDSVTTGGVTVGAVMTPDSTIDLRYSDGLRRLSVLVRRSDLESAFHAMWADLPRPGDFALGLDLRHSQVASWVQLVGWAAADLARSDSLSAHPLLAGQMEDLIVNGFLAAGCRRLSSVCSRERPMTPVAMRRAREYIESRAADPVTVADAARVAGVSVRTLQHGFRRHYGVTPTAYLRQVRLDRAHHELRSAEPHAGVTVTNTALRWGFGHLPRFAAAYQRKFGLLPSETLRHAVTRTQQARPSSEV